MLTSKTFGLVSYSTQNTSVHSLSGSGNSKDPLAGPPTFNPQLEPHGPPTTTLEFIELLSARLQDAAQQQQEGGQQPLQRKTPISLLYVFLHPVWLGSTRLRSIRGSGSSIHPHAGAPESL
ncbi:hypothetical protein Emed_006963 [Eimeria media]